MMVYCHRSSGIWSSCGWLLVASSIPWVLAQENRTVVNLKYQLQINFTDSIRTIGDAVAAVENATQVLLFNLLAQKIGTGSSNADSDVILQSSLKDPCWNQEAPSDACYSVETEASILVPTGINPAIVTLATTNAKVQAMWMNDIHQSFPDVLAVSSLPDNMGRSDAVNAFLTIRLQSDAPKIMNDNEIAVFETTVLQSLIEAASHSNITYLSLHAVRVVSQLLVLSSMHQRYLQQSTSYDNFVNTTVSGNCNGCTSNQFSNIINDAVDSPNFQKKLKENGQGGSNSKSNTTTYFDSVTNTSVTVSTISGIRSNSYGGGASAAASGSNSGFSNSGAPLELWVILASCFGLLIAVLILLLVLAARRQRRANDEAEAKDDDEEVEVDEKEYNHNNRRRRPGSYHKPSDVTDEDDDVY